MRPKAIKLSTDGQHLKNKSRTRNTIPEAKEIRI